MPDLDGYLGFIDIDPGVNAGYRRGRNRGQTVKLHRTYGAYGGDYAVGKRGYFQLYVPKDRNAVQFAEAGSINWDSGEWNDNGPGIEFEGRNEDILTEHQVKVGGFIIKQLIDRGVPATYYNGFPYGRVQEGSISGFIGHGALIQSEQHYDIITYEDWNRLLAAAGATPGPSPVPGPPPAPVGVDYAAIIKYIRDLSALFAKPDAPTIAKGSTNALWVAQLQNALNIAIQANLKVDGDFGNNTERAVKAFQRFFGLQDDGVVGPKTRGVLAYILARKAG